MMGWQPKLQKKLFYSKFNLDRRIRKDHILRKINKHINFDFIYNQVKATYGSKGNVSVPPPVILKMMLLLILYNVRSERELMSTIPERLDWLWFLGYDLDDQIPDHSVLSKARARWGVVAFKAFFERIVWQCVDAGLVDGRKLFMDGCLIQANASNNSVVNKESLTRYLNKSYQTLESRLDTQPDDGDDDDDPKPGAANKKHISTTDPDASVTRMGKGKSKLKYQVHRGVDDKCEIITATEVTSGSVNEAHRLKLLLSRHHQSTGRKAQICVADSKYGTIENYLACFDLGVNSHFESVERAQRGSGRQKGILPKEAFIYNQDDDSFSCPAGQKLKRRSFNGQRQQYEYCMSKKICNCCRLREQCTRSSMGRSLKRHLRQEDLDVMLKQAKSPAAKRDIKTRQHLMERSFARATRYGLQRARWRRLWRVQIQEYLTATIQNLMVLLRHVKEPSAALSRRVNRPRIHIALINLSVQVFAMSKALAYRSRQIVYSF
jgi:transposase